MQKRMQHTSDRLLMPQVPTELFIRACKEVVKANQEWLGPYGSGATLYLRPFLFGTGENIGVKLHLNLFSLCSAALLAHTSKVV